MPYARSPLADLRAQSQSDLAAKLPGSDPLLRFSNLRILADLMAEGINGAYGYLDYIARQGTPFTAQDEAAEGWAGLKGVTRKPATAATGTWAASGATPGVVLPAQTPISRGDSVAYITTADATVSGGGVVAAPISAVDAGAAGTIDDGVAMVLGQAVAGIPSTGTATSVTPGQDVEPFDAFRTRYLAVYANPPQGGARSDYEGWALDLPGVTRAWCVPNGQGPGTVVVYFMMDVSRSAEGGFPQGANGVASGETRDVPATGDQLMVANAILPLQPVTALVYAYAPAQNVVNFTISLAGVSDALKTQIAAAISGAFLDNGSPGGTVNIDDIDAAIRVLPGSTGFVITAESCNHGAIAPADGNITSNAGYLPVLGVLSWI